MPISDFGYSMTAHFLTIPAHAIAAALDKKLICVNYADIESKYVGETSKNLSRLFSDPANKEDIIFFDEADPEPVIVKTVPLSDHFR